MREHLKSGEPLTSMPNESIENESWSSEESLSALKEIEETPASASEPAPKASHEIPNGGFNAWLQVLGSFLLFLNSWYGLSSHLHIT